MPYASFVSRWHSAPASLRDAVWISVLTVASWLVIERTETCDRFFDWVAENPDYELDSVILAFLLASFGIMAYAIRRYRDAHLAMFHRTLAEQAAQKLAYHDPLTGLPNRRALNERLDAMAKGGPDGVEVGLLIVDLDRFKGVNDVHGHLVGDQLLRLVARRLTESLGKGQTAYRLGGDEFAVVCDLPSGDHQPPQHVARRIVQALAEPFEDGGLVHHIGASIGIAMFPGDATDRETLLRRTDIALYRAKRDGRGRHRSFEGAMDAEIGLRARLEEELRVAVARDELRPFYQPLVELGSGRVTGFEMLARWPRPDGQFVGPDVFIPIAEEAGLINDLMLRLLARACKDVRTWDPQLTVSINVAPVQLKDPGIVQSVLGILEREGLQPQRLVVEITETALIEDTDVARRVIDAFTSRGIQVALDDFGTGYSSLHHLRMLPFQRIKIDRSFVQGMESNPESIKIVRAIASLATSLDLPVVAEGIESPVVAAQLLELGCAYGQGYHYGRPLPADVASQIARSAPNGRMLDRQPA